MPVILLQSIRAKLMLITAGTSAVALLLAGVVIVLAGYFETRNALVRDMTVRADLLASSTTAALTFDDERAATEALAHLHVVEQIRVGALYRQDGSLLASYQRLGMPLDLIPSTASAEGVHFDDDWVTVIRPVTLDGTRVGTALIRSDVSLLREWLWKSGSTVAAAALLSMLVGFVAAMRLQRSVSEPLLALEKVARSVSEKRDYTVRAHQKSEGEVATLVEAFNSMLDQIQIRDRQLEAHQAHLEEQVAARTVELTATNLKLQREIDERMQAETALKQSQEQLLQSQKMEAVGKLAGGIAHEFNNLLQMIKGYCYFLLPELAKQESLRKDVEGIEQSADRAAALTSQLLAFSRRQVILPRILDLNAIVMEQHRLLARLIGVDIELVVDLAPELLRVKADPTQIGQVLLNLVNNARDAMPNGGVLTITTANRVLQENGDEEYPEIPCGVYAMLAVRDTGCGMSPEVAERIFEPFFTTKEVGKGTGLGLSMVYGLIAQSGGHIRVVSRPGQGTLMTILLPAVAQNLEAAGSSPPPAGPLTGTETILIAEDEPAVRKLLQAALGAKGYRVLQAENGQAALRVCRDHAGPIHLAVVDLVMPEMGGRELARKLVLRYPNLKILYMSGYTDQPLDLEELPDSRKAFLLKPFASEDLLRILRDLLDEA
ncbi:MAG: response regulator [Nitrospira sp.]|nr:response regulator [Nitrospira sp.]